MPSAATAPAAPPAATAAAPAPTFGDNKGIKFQITTGGKLWECTLQDRSAYERKKATRADSTDSTSSSGSN